MDPLLEVEAEGLLDVDHVDGVVERLAFHRLAQGRAELVPDRGVDEVEGQRDADLQPPLERRFGGGPAFRRGDSNADGDYNIGDAVFTLSELFTTGSAGSKGSTSCWLG